MEHYFNTESSFHAISRAFEQTPLDQPFVCSPVQTVPTHGGLKRRVVKFFINSPQFSVDHRIPPSGYLWLPGIDCLVILFCNMDQADCFIKRISNVCIGGS